MQAVPVMMAGSIQLAVPSQLRLCEMPPVWFTLEEEDDDEDEDEEELGSPPKLMLMLGKSALSPSCHSFTFRLSTEALFSVWEGDGGVSKHPCEMGEMNRRWRKRKKKQLSVSIFYLYDTKTSAASCVNLVINFKSNCGKQTLKNS